MSSPTSSAPNENGGGGGSGSDNHNFTATLASYIDNLINASKSGNMTSALLWLGQINALEVTATETKIHNHSKSNSNSNSNSKDVQTQQQVLPLNLLSVRYIFRPQPNRKTNKNKDRTNRNGNQVNDKGQGNGNGNGKSALYHAAANGHYDLVEYYLSLYLVYAVRITLDSINTKQSFRSWFKLLNNTDRRKKNKNKSITTVKNSSNNNNNNQKMNMNMNVNTNIDTNININMNNKQKQPKEHEKLSSSPSSSSSSSPSSSFFSLADYDQCVIQSLEGNHDNVKNVMVKKQVDISYAMKVVDRASFSCVPYATLIEPRLTKIQSEMKSVTEREQRRKRIMMMRTDLTYDDDDEEDDGVHIDNHIYQDNNVDDGNVDYDSSDVEKEYIVVENSDHGSNLRWSIQYVSIEKDILAVEVELHDKTKTNGTYFFDEQDHENQSTINDENTLQSHITRASWLPHSLAARKKLHNSSNEPKKYEETSSSDVDINIGMKKNMNKDMNKGMNISMDKTHSHLKINQKKSRSMSRSRSRTQQVLKVNVRTNSNSNPIPSDDQPVVVRHRTSSMLHDDNVKYRHRVGLRVSSSQHNARSAF